MNIKQTAKDNYKIFINLYFFNGNIEEKEQVIDFVKDIILKSIKFTGLLQSFSIC